MPQSGLNLRKLEDLLKDESRARKLVEETGIPRDQLDQFVEGFKKPPEGASREGKTREVDASRDNQILNPSQPGDGLKGATVSGRGERGPNSVVQDSGGNLQGNRPAPPSAIRSTFQEYLNRLSTSRRPSRGSAPRAPSPGAGGG